MSMMGEGALQVAELIWPKAPLSHTHLDHFCSPGGLILFLYVVSLLFVWIEIALETHM